MDGVESAIEAIGLMITGCNASLSLYVSKYSLNALTGI